MLWWIFGLGLSLTASLFGTLGKVLLKSSHVHGENFPIFVLATVCVVVLNPLFDAMSYAYAAQSVLAPMAGLSIAWNIVLSPIILQEKVTTVDKESTKWILLGCMLVGLSGSHKVPDHNMDEIFALFCDQFFMLYSVLVFMACCALTFIILKFPVESRSRRFAFGVMSGLVGGNLFFLKAAVELVHIGGPVWQYVETYCIIGCALGTAGGGIYLLNAGLRDYDALYLVAVYQSFLIVIGSISGVVFFKETAGMNALWQQCLYPISILITINGIIMLSIHRSSREEHGDRESIALVQQNMV